MGLYTWAHIYTNTYSCCFYWGIHHQDTNAPHAGIFVKATAKFLKNKFLIFFGHITGALYLFLLVLLPSEKVLLVVALYLGIQL